ncbi:GLPGLI family protein [Flavobacterium sp. NKUCC04_CG]|uniref:GLPGLI family protein n=1 Tax=Flavobacterium sp. NKUCC04_CG TaxID=2842121 RepID=UPI001C5BB45E|nr:GLPGLI family protein [Flavobacterium sp. NKUCC04_CG]MBW3519921.1 GLPGLI family protein [Flavobacterium sp. NKUCC04_CG]
MMQRLHLLIALLFATNIYAQQEYTVITYIGHHNLDRPAVTEDILYLSPDQKTSYYQLGPYKFTKDLAFPKELGKVIVVQDKSSGNTDQFLYFDFDKGTLHSRVIPWKKPYLIKEPIPTMRWKLHQETKIIDNKTLHKATTTFRGRNYTAWYSLDYPISIGPWKFNNLPGLAFAITEENENYSWYLTDIKKEMLKALPLHHDLNRGAISLKDFSVAFHNEIKLEDRMFSSRLPKDLEIISSKSNSNELFKKQIELTYD